MRQSPGAEAVIVRRSARLRVKMRADINSTTMFSTIAASAKSSNDARKLKLLLP